MKLIDLEYALKQIEIGEFEHRGIFESDSSHIKDFLNALPTVDIVEVVHGRWERMVGMMPPEYHGRHKCSCCGVKALDWKFYEELSNYCPNCGAKMDGD